MIELGVFKEVGSIESNVSRLTENVDINSIDIIEMDQPLYKVKESYEINQDKCHSAEYQQEDRVDRSSEDILKLEHPIQYLDEQMKDQTEVSGYKKGGSYKEVFTPGEGETNEVHHMPANDANGLNLNDGPAIKMDKSDHRETASCGNSREARVYREVQRELVEQGEFKKALQMDIDDISEKFGDKYDDAISEMLEYVDEIEAKGMI